MASGCQTIKTLTGVNILTKPFYWQQNWSLSDIDFDIWPTVYSENFVPVLFSPFFYLWPEGEFKTGLI